MNNTLIITILLTIITFDYILELILSYLNLKYQKNKLPEIVKDIYLEDKFKKSQDYFTTNLKFGFITSTLSFLLMVFVLALGILGKLDLFTKEISQNSYIQPLLFFGFLFLLSDSINIPFSIYKNFVIEEKYGFNKLTAKLFILDKLKGYLLTASIGGAILTLFLWLLESMGQNFWVWFWIALAIIIVFVNMFYTSLLLPLFNKLTPLEEGPLRSAIESYSKKVDFPLTNIVVMDGSKRSSKSNAFFSGFGGKKKIVLYDTLIQNHSQEELVAVLAHEAGHYKKKHLVTSMIVSILQIGFTLFLLSLFIFNENLSLALGATSSVLHLNLIAFLMLYSPISHVTGILSNLWSRKNEFEADRYAADTYSGKALTNALKKLSGDNLSNLTPHPATVFVHYSHPPLIERLYAINNID